MMAINGDDLMKKLPELKDSVESGEAGKIWINADYNEPLPEDILKEFYK